MMYLWTPRHQEALPLKRYLLLRRRILRFHLFNILMILLVRNLPAPTPRVTREALPLERHPYQR